MSETTKVIKRAQDKKNRRGEKPGDKKVHRSKPKGRGVSHLKPGEDLFSQIAKDKKHRPHHNIKDFDRINVDKNALKRVHEASKKQQPKPEHTKENNAMRLQNIDTAVTKAMDTSVSKKSVASLTASEKIEADTIDAVMRVANRFNWKPSTRELASSYVSYWSGLSEKSPSKKLNHIVYRETQKRFAMTVLRNEEELNDKKLPGMKLKSFERAYNGARNYMLNSKAQQ